MSSTDGVNWAEGASFAGQDLRAVAYGHGEFVAIGDNSDWLGHTIMRSSDGITLHNPNLDRSDLVARRDEISNAQPSKVILDGLPTTSDRQFYRATSQ